MAASTDKFVIPMEKLVNANKFDNKNYINAVSLLAQRKKVCDVSWTLAKIASPDMLTLMRSTMVASLTVRMTCCKSYERNKFQKAYKEQNVNAKADGEFFFWNVKL